MKCKKICYSLLLSIAMICSLIGCGKKEESKVSEKIKTEQEIPEEEDKLDDEAANIVAAIQKTSQLSAFQIDSVIQLNLNGNYIHLNANIQADTEIVQSSDPDDLQMSTVSTTNLDDLTSYAYYKDGIYYTDDQNGKKKEEKTPEEVMAMVTDITTMVADAAEEIDEIAVTEDGKNRIYSYTVPSYIAEDYLKQLAESAAAAETPLSGAKADVEKLHMNTTVDQSGLVIKQEATMTGTIKKSFFKIPADASVTATFTPTQKTSLDIHTW